MIVRFVLWDAPSRLAEALAATRLSQILGEQLWAVPLAQSLHILSVAAIMTFGWLLSLRILGFGGRLSVLAINDHFGPWLWRAIAVLAATGAVLIVAEPSRQLTNFVFYTKMALLTAALFLTAELRRAASNSNWDAATGAPLATRALAALGLGLWLAIAVAGRWIAYAEHT